MKDWQQLCGDHPPHVTPTRSISAFYSIYIAISNLNGSFLLPLAEFSPLFLLWKCQLPAQRMMDFYGLPMLAGTISAGRLDRPGFLNGVRKRDESSSEMLNGLRRLGPLRLLKRRNRLADDLAATGPISHHCRQQRLRYSSWALCCRRNLRRRHAPLQVLPWPDRVGTGRIQTMRAGK